MAQDWQVGHSTGRCSVSDRELMEGEEFYAVLFEDGDSFRRADYSLESWTGPPPDSFCHFKTRVPVKEKKKRLLVDDELLMNFFLRLGGESDASRVRFRFVLALILMRKRLLRYETTESVDGQEFWTMTAPKDHATHKLLNPHLTDDQIEGVSEQITLIMHGDMGAWSTMDEMGADDADDADGANASAQTDASTCADGTPSAPEPNTTRTEPLHGNA